MDSTNNILQKAVDELDKMTSQEVVDRTLELDIEVPKATAVYDEEFLIDLHGAFKEAINSY